jgi:pimeloyl-ACP methyl ester carboxylesterase
MNAMLNYDRANPVDSWYLDYAHNGPGLPNCQVPTMVIYPEQDMFLWEEQAVETPKYVDADCRTEKMQGSHWAMLDHPEEFNHLMLDWLS